MFAELMWRIEDVNQLEYPDFVKVEKLNNTIIVENNFKTYSSESENEDKYEEPTECRSFNAYFKKQNFSKFSSLNIAQHKVCIKALQILEKGIPVLSCTEEERQIVNTYNNLKWYIAKENAEFQEFVEKQWKEIVKVRLNVQKKSLYYIAKDKWLHKLADVVLYNRFYTPLKVIPISTEKKNVQMTFEKCLLELGSLAKIILPRNGTENRTFKKIEPNLRSEEGMICKLPCSRDKYAEVLAKLNDCDVVITSSGLKAIIDSVSSYKSNWAVPVIVKEYEHNGKKKTVAYVDKALPSRSPTVDELNLMAWKTMLRIDFCKSELQIFEEPQWLQVELSRHQLENRTSLLENLSKDRIYDTDRSCSPDELRTDRSCSLDEFRTDRSCSFDEFRTDRSCSFDEFRTDRSCTSEETRKISEMSDDIIEREVHNSRKLFKEELNGEESKLTLSRKSLRNREVSFLDYKYLKKKLDETRKTHKSLVNFTYHNVSYKKWRIKVNNENNILMKNEERNKEIQVLVRTKLDGCEVEVTRVTPTTILPHLEFQCNYGASLCSKSEMIRDWVSTYFRPGSQIAKVRLNAAKKSYEKVELKDLNKITRDCLKHYNVVPSQGLEVLYNVLSNLVGLQPGNYLLNHTAKHGPFVELLQSVPTNTIETLDLHNLYSKKNCKIDETIKWNPIDTTLVLPYHSMNGTMPGMFPPQFNRRMQWNINTARRKKKKNKSKKRFSSKKKNKLKKLADQTKKKEVAENKA